MSKKQIRVQHPGDSSEEKRADVKDGPVNDAVDFVSGHYLDLIALTISRPVLEQDGRLKFEWLMALVRSPHFNRWADQVNPPPKTGMQTRSPGFTLLSRIASSRAIAHDAEEMLPYL